jgi:hypothetical protein
MTDSRSGTSPDPTRGVTIVVAGFIPALIPVEDYKHVSAKVILRIRIRRQEARPK